MTSRCCWATATAPSSRHGATVRALIQYPWPWVTSMAIGRPTSTLLCHADGTFQPALTFGAGTDAISVAVGDINGDGRPDLAVANTNSNNVSVLLGNGDGTFQPARTFGVGNNPFSVAVGDVNGDGRTDLAVANANSNNVSVLINNTDIATITLTVSKAGKASSTVG